jgi:hypothetical protein
MKTIEVPIQATDVQHILAQARDEDIVVKTPDGEEFLVSAVDEFGHEVAKTRQNEKLMALLEERGQESATVPLTDVKRQLGLGG